MSISIVGVFDERDDAIKASDRLKAAGIDASSIHLESGSTEIPTERRSNRRGFFAELFGIGDDDETSGYYAEAVRRGSVVLTVKATDEDRVQTVSDILEECGAIDIDQRVEQWRAAGYTGYDEGATPYSAEQVAAERARVLPVVEEELKVGKREVQRGRTRVFRRVVETPVEERVTLREERAVVDRQPVDRPATEADMQSFKDETVEIRETAEEPVVSKSARVVEEVRVGKEASERTETVRDTVRRTEVDVENAEDLPASQRRSYTGPDRRTAGGIGSYAGVERRIGI